MKKTSLASLIFIALPIYGFAFDLRPSVKEQIELGQKAAADIRKTEKVLPDSDPRVQFLRKNGVAMLKLIPEAELKKRPFIYSFDVIDSKDINAFALPGGPIFFYTGLIDLMTTQDQVLGVLGHEITHIRNQHWASSYADTMKRQLGITIILQILNANGSIYDAASIVDQGLYSLPNSRKHETEADKFGYEMMSSYAMNPMGMADTFNILAGGKKADGFGEMLSTHPDPAKRATSIIERVKKDPKKFPIQKMLPFKTKAMEPKPIVAPPAKPQGSQQFDLLQFLNASSIVPDCAEVFVDFEYIPN